MENTIVRSCSKVALHVLATVSSPWISPSLPQHNQSESYPHARDRSLQCIRHWSFPEKTTNLSVLEHETKQNIE